MKRNSLGWWLAAINVAIVVLVAAGVSIFAIDVLEGLADSQQRAKVQLGGADARTELNRVGEDALTNARVLSERPTLRRLLIERDLVSMPPFLQRFCTTAGVDACAVMAGEEVLAMAGAAVPWSELRTAIGEQGERFLIAPLNFPQALMGAVATVPDLSGAPTRVYVAHLLDATLAKQLGEQTGFTIRFLNYRQFNTAPEDAFTSPAHRGARRRSLCRGASAGAGAVRLELSGVLGHRRRRGTHRDARCPRRETDNELAALKWRLLAVAAALALLALLGGVLLGRRVTAPAEALNDRRAAPGPGRFRDGHSHGRPGRDRPARTHDGRHAPQPHRAYRHAAPARSRSAGGAGRHRRGCVRGGCHPAHHLHQRHRGKAARNRALPTPSGASAVMC